MRVVRVNACEVLIHRLVLSTFWIHSCNTTARMVPKESKELEEKEDWGRRKKKREGWLNNF